MKYIPGIFSLASLPIVFSVALGQLPSVRFDRLYPPSAKQGAEVELKIAGADLEDLKWIKFSHDSLKAEPKKSDDGEYHPGELGGCSAGPTNNSGTAAMLLMAGFLLVRVRRNK